MVKVGIIGGSGLEDPRFMKDQLEIQCETPYGKPSSPLMVGKISGVEVVIISRHGKGHTIMPTNVPIKRSRMHPYTGDDGLRFIKGRD